MRIEEFMNKHSNWEELLTTDPYNIKVKRDGEYVLLEYNMLASDLSNEIVQQCRGSIFYQLDGEWRCVCRPFRKFFNVQEENAAKIDWSTAYVREKIDGSLMKLWYHKGWHLSTNGAIDAFKCQVNLTTFGEIFERIAGCDVDTFCENFNIDYTYMFELTSPESRLVIPYPDGIYYLCKKHRRFEWEAILEEGEMPQVVKYPNIFILNTLEDCLKAVAEMGQDEEGFVVSDAHGNRVKIKSEQWCLAHKAFNNGHFSVYDAIDMIKDGTIDDYVALVPQFKKYVEQVQEFLNDCIRECRETWDAVSELAGDRKAMAARLKKEQWSDYCFCHLGAGISAEDYVLKRMKTCNLYDIWKVRYQ